MERWQRLCPLAEIGEGQARGFDPLGQGRDSLFALRSAGRVRVYRNSCPHLDVPLPYRKDRYLSADGTRIVCYAHGAQFLPESGMCIYGPCLGEQLSALPWREVEGWLEVEVSRLPIHHIRTCD